MQNFLTHLAVKEKVSELGDIARARKPRRLPVVMTREGVRAVLANLAGDKWLMACLMYGAVSVSAHYETRLAKAAKVSLALPGGVGPQDDARQLQPGILIFQP